MASFGYSGTLTAVRASLIAANTGTDVDLVFSGTNSFDSDGDNLIGDGDATGAFNQGGDQTGVADPGLGPLAENGGPTQTHAPLAGSPAINAVTGTCPPPADGQGPGWGSGDGGHPCDGRYRQTEPLGWCPRRRRLRGRGVVASDCAARSGEKRRVYEQHGVQEYWLVHPTDQVLTVYRLMGAEYGKPDVQELTGETPVGVFWGVTIGWDALAARLPAQNIEPGAVTC